jgi:hypothetical protein
LHRIRKIQLQTTFDMLNATTAAVPHWVTDSNWEWRGTDITGAQQQLRRLIANGTYPAQSF